MKNFIKNLIKYLIEYFQAPKHLAVAVIAVSIVSLIFAYIAQYVFCLEPCILCIYQRVPYFINIALGTLAFMAVSKHPRSAIVLLLIAALVFFAGAIVAVFHVGLQQQWWEWFSSSCGTGIIPTDGLSIEEIREAITQQSTVVRCDKVSWRLFGISLAGYNYMFSVELTLGILYLLGKKKPE
ncbi:MAG: disulfide bond formation protein B [Alphaproteobacteria bacterium]|nr:disulfide bond formation protein B [Alphaproteobacteria bacterium]